MKIAISTSGKTLDSNVEPRFGRSAGFILFDTDTQNVQYLDNAAQQNLSQGAGIQTAQMIAEAGAQVVITGQVGPKAAQVLDQFKIKIHACAGGTVREALQALDQNALKAFSLDDAAQVVPNKPGSQDMGGGGAWAAAARAEDRARAAGAWAAAAGAEDQARAAEAWAAAAGAEDRARAAEAWAAGAVRGGDRD